MVCKDEVCLWFKNNEPHRRLELLCGLLNMCLPMELRFIGTCVEDLGKRDLHDLREAEYKANNTQEIKRLSNLLDERTRSNLIVYIALLSSRNHSCSSLLYSIIAETQHDYTEADSNHLKEMLLIYTMVLHHPAFTFEQKRVIGDLHTQALKLEAKLVQAQDTSREIVASGSQACITHPKGCDSGLSVGTEPEGDALLDGPCGLLPASSPRLHHYHHHPQGVGGLNASQTSECGGNQDACSSGSGESSELYNEGGTVSTTYIYNSNIYDQQSLVALTMAPSYTCNHPSSFHYYQYSQMLGTVSGVVPPGKGSHSDGSSSEEGSANLAVTKVPPASNSPLSSPQSSPYVSPLQSLSPSRASSPLSRPATTTTATTTTTLASLPSAVVVSAVCSASGSCSHSSPVQKQSGGATQTIAAAHGGAHSVTCSSAQPHRKPPSSGSRSQRHTDRSGSRTRLPASSVESDIGAGIQTSQNSPSAARVMNQPSYSNNSSNHVKSRWSRNSPGVVTASTSSSTCAASSASVKSTTKQSPCPTSGNTTTCRILTTATVTASSTGCKTTSLSSHAASGSLSTSISSSATNATRNTSPPVVQAGNHDKSTPNTSTTSGIRPPLSTGSSTIPSIMHKPAMNNNNCLNIENKHEFYNQVSQYPIEKLMKMSDKDFLDLGLNKEDVSRIRNVLANLDSPVSHLHNGYTNPTIPLHPRSSPLTPNTTTTTNCHTPPAHHPNTATTCSSSRHSPASTCHASSPVTTTCHASSNSPTSSQAPSPVPIITHVASSSSNAVSLASSFPTTSDVGQTSPRPHSPSQSPQFTQSNSTLGSSEMNCASQSSGDAQNTSSNIVTTAVSNSKMIIVASDQQSNTVSAVSPSSAQTVTSSITTTTTASSNISASTSSTVHSTSAVLTTTGDPVLTTTAANSTIATQVTQCHSVTVSSSPKDTPVMIMHPKSVPCVNGSNIPAASTCISSTTSHSPCNIPASAPTPQIPHYMTVPPPPLPSKMPPPNSATASNLSQHQLPPGQHRTPPPPQCIPPRTPSQEPCTLSSTAASLSTYYASNCGVGGKNNSNIITTAASTPHSIANYASSVSMTFPQPSGGNVTLPIYTSGGSMAVYTSSGNIGVPPPSNGGLYPIVSPGQYPQTYIYPFPGGPGSAPGYVPPGTYAAQHPHRALYMSHLPAVGTGNIGKMKAVPHAGTPGNSGSRGGSSSSSSSSSSSCSNSSRGFNKGCHKGHNQGKSCTRSSDSSPSSSQYSSPPQTPSPNHTPDISTDKRGKISGDVEVSETGESLGMAGSGASEDGTPPPFHQPQNPVLLPQQAGLTRPRIMHFPHFGYVGFHQGSMIRYPNSIPLPTQAPLITPRNSLSMNNDKSSRETTPPVAGTVPLVPQDLSCCIRPAPDGSTIPNSLTGSSQGRNGGSPHGPLAHPDGPPPPSAHTPVLSGASHPTAPIPPGNTTTGAPHNSVQYNPSFPVVMSAPLFPHFQGYMPAHSSHLSNGFVSPPLPQNFAFPPIGNGMNAEFVYSNHYPLMGGSSQGGGGGGCGTPGGLGAPSAPGPGLPYTHYSPALPHTPTPSAGAKKTCYNCGDHGHTGAECKEANYEETCNSSKAARS